jgi:hypothetical protein
LNPLFLFSFYTACQGLGHTIRFMSQRFACPCCANLTLGEQPPGTYWNCEVCGWEDHPGTFEDLEFVCGTNAVGLREARANYLRFGASDTGLISKVRKPLPEELPRNEPGGSSSNNETGGRN